MPSYLGFECPEGFELVRTAAGPVCAWRGHAPCLGGGVDEAGHFVCTDFDFPCPPGMSTRRGSPPNWCYPSGAERTGAESASEDFLRRIREAKALGRPIPPEYLAAAVQAFGKGILGAFEGLGLPKIDFSNFSLPPTQLQAGPGLDVEKASEEASHGMKAAAAIVGVAILGATMIYVLGKGTGSARG